MDSRKLEILPHDGIGRDSQSKSGLGRGTGQSFDVLPRDGPGRDFDSLSRPKIPGIFDAALVPGQKDSETRIFLSQDKGSMGRPVPW